MTSFCPAFVALLVSLHRIRKMSSPCSGFAKFTGLLLCLYISAIHPSTAGTNQWTQIGPQAASLNALVIDPANPSILYSASGHIISKSIDGGGSWARLSEVPKSTTDICGLNDLVIHPLSSAIYAGTCEGVFKSTDGGISWVAANSGISTFRVIKIVPDPSNASMLYILSDGGIFKTTNGGADWIFLRGGYSGVFTISIDPASPSALFIGLNGGTEYGVYKSTDGGNNWNKSSAGLPYGSVNDIKIAGNVVYAATSSGVYKSVNGGSVWSLAGSGMPDQANVMKIATGTGNTTTVYAAVRESSVTDLSEWLTIYRSTDGSASWVAASFFDESQARYDSTVLVVSSQNASTIFATTRVGLAKSTDGASTWSYSTATSGLPLAPARVVGMDSANPYNLYTVRVDLYGGSYRSTDKGQSWFPLSLAEGSPVSLASVSKNYQGVVYGTNEYGYPMSSNYGLNWTKIFRSFMSRPTMASVLDVASAPGVMYITSYSCFSAWGICGHDIMKSSDNGVTWNQVMNGIPQEPYFYNNMPLPMISDPSNPNIFYVGGLFGVYKTTNNCGVWVNHSSGLPAGTVSSIVMDPTNPNVLYAGVGYSRSVPTGGGVYKSTDSAVTWSAVNTGLTNLIVTNLAIDPTNPSNIYAATDGGGVFRSMNGGADWSPVNSGLSETDSLSVNSIVLDAQGRDMFIGTNFGVYSYSFGQGAQTSEVIEFYNTILDHYFITADSNEAAGIDGGLAGPGWSRTGNTFKSGGDTPACRFYGSQSPGPNSHFYTVDAGECAWLKQLQASTPGTEKRWNFESLDFFSTPPTNGTCPGGTVPVYRAYNNGFLQDADSNHRITGSPTAIQEVVARGWINEGVVMCAPQ